MFLRPSSHAPPPQGKARRGEVRLTESRPNTAFALSHQLQALDSIQASTSPNARLTPPNATSSFEWLTKSCCCVTLVVHALG